MQHERSDNSKHCCTRTRRNRSGTSAVAGLLQRFGVDLGHNLLPPGSDNPKGFFENVDFLHFHDELLALLGSSWDDPSSLRNGWQREPEFGSYRDRLVAFITRNFSESDLWGVKDPRMCRLLPLWIQILDELKTQAKAVLVIRDPDEVAASLHERNGLDVDQCMTLWLSHILNAERQSRGLRRTVVLYNDVLADWQAEIQRLRDVLDIDLAAFTDDVVSGASGFIDRALQHHRGGSIPALRAPHNAYARAVFESMVQWRREGILSLDVLAEADEELSRAERSAYPFIAYSRSRAEAEPARHAARPQPLEERRRSAAAKTIRRTSEPGRNAACPCGSGKKFKKCCASSYAQANR